MAHDTVYGICENKCMVEVMPKNRTVPVERTVAGLALSVDIPATQLLNCIGAEKAKLIFNNISVATSTFVSNATYEDFPFRAAIALSGITSNMVPEVILGVVDAMSGNFAPVAETYSGGIYLYAAEVPAAAITIPTIICWR